MLESQLDSRTVLLLPLSSNNSAVFIYQAGRPATSGEAGHKGAGLKPRHPSERAPGATFYKHTSIFLLCNVFTTSADLPDTVPMFQIANLMQSGTLEVFFRLPTGFPAGHQV